MVKRGTGVAGDRDVEEVERAVSDSPRRLWPPKLAEIADYCGEDVALALWEKFPGCRVFVPAAVYPGHPLAEALGPEMAARLCRVYPGEYVNIANGLKARLAARNALIRARLAEGASETALSLEFRLSYRQINTIAAACRESPQADLFD
jgi:hypothetical protein